MVGHDCDDITILITMNKKKKILKHNSVSIVT